MAYRKPVSVSLPPPLDEKVTRLAQQRHQTKSEFVRAALTRFIRDEEEWEARWRRLRAYGTKMAKEMGISSEEQVYDIMYELRHGRPRLPRADAIATRRR